jgi:hypothetical protein
VVANLSKALRTRAIEPTIRPDSLGRAAQSRNAPDLQGEEKRNDMGDSVMSRIRKTVLLLALALLMAALASAQVTSSLRGTVTDPSGAVVRGAVVTLTSPDTGVKRTTTATNDGVYQFLQVPPGRYTLSVEAEGFSKTELTGIQLLVNTPATTDVTLQVGSVSQQVTVSAAAATLNTEDATVGNAFEENQVKQLPIESRNVVDLLSLQPGAVYLGNRSDINVSEDTRSGSVNGARSDQTMITMDGVDVTDQANGLAFTSILRTTPDSLQEFRVTTSNPTAEGGNSSGSQVALVTKSGTNGVHGALYEFLRNTATSANDFFIKQSQLASGEANKPPKLNRNLFGAAVGGPIKKDQAFFFVNYEGRRDRQENSVVTVVPTATLRAGSVLYRNESGTITTVTPQDFQKWDPLHMGPNNTMLQYFQTFPLPNDQSVGDGLNFGGFRFPAPTPARFDVYIARLDYKLDQNGKHSLFWRGSLQNDFVNGAPYLPGLSPQTVSEDRSKGFALGYTAVLSSTKVNNFRWGLTRASIGKLGDSTEPFIGPNVITGGITRSSSIIVPNHTLADNFSWTRGRHTLEFGATVQLIRDSVDSLDTSFSQARLSTTYINTGGFATTGSPFDPGAQGFPAVSRNFTLSYDEAAFDALGIITNVVANYNYNRNGTLLPQGTPIRRHYALNQYDFYVQDAFRLKPTLTLNVGLRYQLETPPTEMNGLQVSTTFPLGKWFQLREANMLKGLPSNQDPPISFVLGGSANNGPPFYGLDKNNFAPRVSFAYSPRPASGWLKPVLGEGKSSIRGGFAVTYDHFGTELINTFAKNGSFGLATSLVTPLGSQSVDCAPRVTSLTAIPVEGCPGQNNGFLMSPAPPGGFPQTPPIGFANGGLAAGFSLDTGLRTPYVYMVNLGLARELTPTTSLEIAYLGRLSHKLLTQEDFGLPLDVVDPKSHVDYFSAMSRLSQLARANVPLSKVTPALVGPTAAYWNNLFAPIVQSDVLSTPCKAGQCTPLQAIYAMEQLFVFNETFIPFFLDIPDFICPNGCSTLGPYTFYDPQFFSLYGWRSLANANYHALQVSLRQRLTRGVQFDLNYTYSKSLDLTSVASRVGPAGSSATLGAGIINSFDPRQMYGVSDFDMTHQFNANWVAELPFGHGKRYGGRMPGWANAIVGGWQFSGIIRITSGLPFSVSNGLNLPTNGATGGLSTQIGPIKQGGATKSPDGRVLLFPDPTAAFNAYEFTFPGQSGSRNTVRGDGFLSWDSSLSKRWLMPYNEKHSVQFRWEVFNVGNFTRFDVNSNPPDLTNSNNFGTYTGLLTNPRVMQFALRYEF